MVFLTLLSITLVVLGTSTWAQEIITRDLVGEFVLESGTLPICASRFYSHYPFDLESNENLNVNFGFYINNTQVSCSSKRGAGLMRVPASFEMFGASSSSIGTVLTTSKPHDCTLRSFPRSNGTHSGSEVTGNISISVTGVIPRKQITVKGISLSPKKRYFIATASNGYCIYSAPTLKRIDIRGSYNLVRSPLLKKPPSYCKSSLEIRGIPGEVNASQLLFNGRPDPCLKGTSSFVQVINITFPIVTKMVQNAIPYYALSHSSISCGKNEILAGAAAISADASLANLVTIKGARYFGMVDLGPRESNTSTLENMRVCLYTSYTGQSNSVWTWLRDLFGW